MREEKGVDYFNTRKGVFYNNTGKSVYDNNARKGNTRRVVNNRRGSSCFGGGKSNYTNKEKETHEKDETDHRAAHRNRSGRDLKVACLRNQSIEKVIQVLIMLPVTLMTRDVLCQLLLTSIQTEIFSRLNLNLANSRITDLTMLLHEVI